MATNHTVVAKDTAAVVMVAIVLSVAIEVAMAMPLHMETAVATVEEPVASNQAKEEEVVVLPIPTKELFSLATLASAAKRLKSVMCSEEIELIQLELECFKIMMASSRVLHLSNSNLRTMPTKHAD